MLFERFEAEGLAHYSYAVGCPGAGAIAIVDPERNIERYLDYARRNDVRITHVLETHIHADYASGARELAARTGAELGVSAYDEGETYTASFPHRDLKDGDTIQIGPVTIETVHTPGHTPEHLAFLVYDGVRSTELPVAMLSGDFLFVGSLGRPDLLGEEQKRGLAHKLYESVRDLETLPDSLEIHPAHGAGSLCGAGLSGRPTSTLGYERATNPYLSAELSEEEFVERILGNVPPFPPYYLRMKALNAEGATAPNRTLRAVHADELRDGYAVVDLRDRVAFAGGHVPGSINVQFGASAVVWASWLVPEDRPVVFVGDEEQARAAARMLARVGLDHVEGWLEGGIEAWQTAGQPMATTLWADVNDLPEDAEVIDVRSAEEFADGHIPGARHIFLGELPQQAETLKGPVALVCLTGDRSTTAASLLERVGHKEAYSVTGGMEAWNANAKEIQR
jgi:hydroxyacylglutathione hydrolase